MMLIMMLAEMAVLLCLCIWVPSDHAQQQEVLGLWLFAEHDT